MALPSLNFLDWNYLIPKITANVNLDYSCNLLCNNQIHCALRKA